MPKKCMNVVLFNSLSQESKKKQEKAVFFLDIKIQVTKVYNTIRFDPANRRHRHVWAYQKGCQRGVERRMGVPKMLVPQRL